MKDFFRDTCSMLLIVCLFIYFGGFIIKQEKGIRDVDDQIEIQKELLAEANKKTMELREEKNTMMTEESIEEYGRNRGLLKDGDIKFVISYIQ